MHTGSICQYIGLFWYIIRALYVGSICCHYTGKMWCVRQRITVKCGGYVWRNFWRQYIGLFWYILRALLVYMFGGTVTTVKYYIIFHFFFLWNVGAQRSITVKCRGYVWRNLWRQYIGLFWYIFRALFVGSTWFHSSGKMWCWGRCLGSLWYVTLLCRRTGLFWYVFRALLVYM